MLRREDIRADELTAAGDGDPLQAPQELVAVLRQKALYNHQYPAIGFDLSPDGSTVAYNFGGPRVYLWDVPTRTERTLEMPRRAGIDARCPSLTFSPDGKKLALATGQSMGLIVLWDLDRSAIEYELHVEKHAVDWVAFSPDGRTLAGVYMDRQIRLWNVATGKQSNGFGEKITSLLRFSPDGQILATLNEGRLAFYDPASGELLRHLFDTPRDFCFRPDSRAVAIVDSPLGTLKVLDPADGKVLRTIAQGRNVINSAAYAPSGKLLAARDVGSIWLWDADTGQERGRIELKQRGKQGAVRFSPDGRHVLTANTDGTIYILRLAPGMPESD
jgi:WD40 repeat protein